MSRLRALAVIASFTVFGLSAPLVAQDDAEPLTWAGYSLTNLGQPDQVSVDTVRDLEVLTVTRTTVMLDGAEFAEGVIEFDIAFEAKRGFGGLLWHANGPDTEYFYIRQHKSGLPDAGQYTPIRNGLTSWQIYSDRNAIAPFSFTHTGWNRFRMIVADDKADIYFNGSPQPVLHIPDLAIDLGSGGIGFRSSGPQGRLRIANLVIRPLAEGESVIGQPTSDRSAPSGTIMRWSVSQRFAEEAIAGTVALPTQLSELGTLGILEVEPFGIADISRLAGPEEELDTVLVTARIVADQARRARFSFGYSDRVRLYLNGDLVFDGSAGFRARDFFFLGTVGFEDAVMLDLKQGENVLTAAVSETFGGWGFAGAIAERGGLTIIP